MKTNYNRRLTVTSPRDDGRNLHDVPCESLLAAALPRVTRTTVRFAKSFNNTSRGSPIRRGVSTLELLVASIAISAAVLITVTAMAIVHVSRRRSEQVQLGVQELNNQLERLSDQNWSELSTERLASISMPANVAERLPGAKLTVSVAEIGKPRRAKQLTAQIQWSESHRETHPPLRLTTWVFATKETP